MTDISKELAASIFRLLEFFYPDDLGRKFLRKGGICTQNIWHRMTAHNNVNKCVLIPKKKQLQPELHDDRKYSNHIRWTLVV
jgi:hypothetical protein